jgi:hypothetical protein
MCQQHNNQPLNVVASPQVQEGTVGLNQHFSLLRVSLSYWQQGQDRRRQNKDKIGEDKNRLKACSDYVASLIVIILLVS